MWLPESNEKLPKRRGQDQGVWHRRPESGSYFLATHGIPASSPSSKSVKHVGPPPRSRRTVEMSKVLQSEDPTAVLLQTYAELNSSSIEELDECPSALEFLRYVKRNRPFVVRKGAQHWKATRTWDRAYLEAALRDQSVNVSVSYGCVCAVPAKSFGVRYLEGSTYSLPRFRRNADSPLARDDGGAGDLVFVKPHEEEQAFESFLDHVVAQELGQGSTSSEVRYAQTQNDNLRGEYEILFSDVEKDIPWARIALEQVPDAINCWIGNSKSVTALHKDNYENIYCQIVGQKHFVLLPPLAFACVGEKILKSATYARTGDALQAVEDKPEHSVPFATWDPDKPDGPSTDYSHLADPMRVTLDAGDMLYLPALWQAKPAFLLE